MLPNIASSHRRNQLILTKQLDTKLDLGFIASQLFAGMIKKDIVKQLHATTYLKQKGNNPCVGVNYCNYPPPLIYGRVYDTFNCVSADPKQPRTTLQLCCSHDAFNCLFADSCHCRFWPIHLNWNAELCTKLTHFSQSRLVIRATSANINVHP